jgi:diadenosine tetraphosphatase ApaH/serine/threonine PP2A family protein phosphatase
MRYGFLSDVHGNLEALEVACAHLAEQRIDRTIFLGDAVGYGPNPNEVCDILRPLVDVSVIGNHDAAVCGRMDYEAYYEAARHALDWCKAQVSPRNINWLRELPYKVREDHLEFCHAAPIAPEMFDYLFGVEQVVELLDAYDELAPVTFIGHSHLTISFCIKDNEVTPIIAPQVQCDPEAKYIITVGSVGQPRDRDPRACCGVFDTETNIFEYHRLNYDVQTTRQKILDAGLPAVFGERLLVGV